ncbi:MAG: hypothetical protein A2W98_14625 [Bacteroidetes bacterium GWF2_33_38]|nr:MAG: hypothetical protein A2W98_14625 [Bacteroidetes bacterium GWF2_33_38]OFY76486.1 MAG: hypothetical protein A2265_08765 [Bacteroidetes bacterium RIFOXYA12_FULL_33_9]HBX52622.1 hypothetical protein [Bacteroidales bacterium]
MYFLNQTPQSTLLNPAFKSECKWYLGGVPAQITPVFGQVFSPISFNFNNTSFGLNDFIHPGTGEYKDSLVIDMVQFVNSLHNYNYLTFDFQYELLSFGVKVKDYFFTFHATERVDFKFGYTRDLFQIPLWGNGHPANIGRTANMSFALDFTHYREYAVGVSKEINNKLTVGGRAKLLMGMTNIDTKANDNTWLTDANTFDYIIENQTEVNASLPFVNYLYTDSNTSGNIDSIEFDDFDPAAYLLMGKNKGASLDLGATYKYTDRLTFSLSLVDLGFIRWKNNTFNFTNTGDIGFNGVDISQQLSVGYTEEGSLGVDGDSTANAFTKFADSLLQEFTFVDSSLYYTSYLTPKMYIGGNFKINEKFNVGALVKVEFYKKLIHPSLTLSANSQLLKWLAISGTYTMINREYYNIGLGLSMKMGPFRMFWVNDNMLAFFMPHRSRSVNWRSGIYWAFGCKNEEKAKSTLY